MIKLKNTVETQLKAPQSRGRYTITRTNKFSDVVDVYEQDNLITDNVLYSLYGEGVVVNKSLIGGTQIKYVISLNTDDSTPHGYSMNATDTVYPIRTSRTVPPSLSANDHLLLSSSIVPTTAEGGNMLNIGISVPTPTRVFSYDSSTDTQYLKFKCTAKGFANTGATTSAGKTINSLKLLENLNPRYPVLSWAKLDTPITIATGDVISVTYEIILAIPNWTTDMTSITSNTALLTLNDMQNAGMLKSVATPLGTISIEQYAFGADTAGAPSSTFDSAVTVHTPAALNLFMAIAHKTYTAYASLAATYTGIPIETSVTATQASCYANAYYTNKTTDLGDWVAAGYPTPLDDEIYFAMTVVVLPPMRSAASPDGLISSIGTSVRSLYTYFYSTGDGATLSTSLIKDVNTEMFSRYHALPTVVELEFDPSIPFPAGSRPKFVVETLYKFTLPPTAGVDLDVSTLPSDVKTAFGIA